MQITRCDVLKKNLIDDTIIVISVDDAINELSNYYDTSTLEARLMKGQRFPIPNYVYVGAPYIQLTN